MVAVHCSATGRGGHLQSARKRAAKAAKETENDEKRGTERVEEREKGNSASRSAAFQRRLQCSSGPARRRLSRDADPTENSGGRQREEEEEQRERAAQPDLSLPFLKVAVDGLRVLLCATAAPLHAHAFSRGHTSQRRLRHRPRERRWRVWRGNRAQRVADLPCLTCHPPRSPSPRGAPVHWCHSRAKRSPAAPLVAGGRRIFPLSPRSPRAAPTGPSPLFPALPLVDPLVFVLSLCCWPLLTHVHACVPCAWLPTCVLNARRLLVPNDTLGSAWHE